MRSVVIVFKKMKLQSVDTYIKSFPKETQKKLREMRRCIHSAVPDAEESMKWSMPAFSYKRILVIFGGFKRHIGFYPTPSAIKTFENELSNFKKARGSIQFPLNKPLPLNLIRKITKFRATESVEQDTKWKVR